MRSLTRAARHTDSRRKQEGIDVEFTGAREPQITPSRIVVGFLLWHGVQKLFDSRSHRPRKSSYGRADRAFGASGDARAVHASGCFLCSGQMAVAYWMAHAFRAPLPIVNQGELAVTYCFVFLYIAARQRIWRSTPAARRTAFT
jgi:putative oxidoreductase